MPSSLCRWQKRARVSAVEAYTETRPHPTLSHSPLQFQGEYTAQNRFCSYPYWENGIPYNLGDKSFIFLFLNHQLREATSLHGNDFKMCNLDNDLLYVAAACKYVQMPVALREVQIRMGIGQL